jgi:hypothetical protein
MTDIVADKEELVKQVEESVSRNSSSSNSTSISAEDDHPLQDTPSIAVQQEDDLFVDDRTLLDNQGRPNISRTPTPSAIVTLDSDTSHAKVKEKDSPPLLFYHNRS